MFGIKQKRLVKNLAKLTAKSCSYLGNRGCDCKYIHDDMDEDRIMTGSESGSGCPELSMATYLIAAMTDQEFNAIAKRAGISITDDGDETIDADAMIKEAKEARDKLLVKNTAFLPVVKKRNSKSAYDLSSSKAAMRKMVPAAKK